MSRPTPARFPCFGRSPHRLSPDLVRTISRRSWAVPLTGLGVSVLAGLGWRYAYVGFVFVPLVAWLLGRGVARKPVAIA